MSYSTVKIFDKEIKVKTKACNLAPVRDIIYNLHTPKMELQIMVNNTCQANCPFCTQHSNKNNNFDYEKLEKVLNELRRVQDEYGVKLAKLNFTGGEPLLNIDKYRKINDIVFSKFTREEIINTTLNTNGVNLGKLDDELVSKLNYISLSRHHYDDKLNREIFRTCLVPSAADIKAFNEKFPDVLYFRCNMIKGYIDSAEEIQKYCDFVISNSCHHCGFMSLMELNQFCKNNFVEVKIPDTVNFCGIIERFKYNDDNKLTCNCFTDIYYSDNGWCDIISWNRNMEAKGGPEGILVFDGEYLRYGFFGEIIC